MTTIPHPDLPGDVNDLLLVEDNPRDIRLIEEIFSTSPLGVTVHSVASSGAAINFLQRRGEYTDASEPDVVFVKWNLFEETDDDVVTTLQADYPYVPVVMLTGSKTRAEGSQSDSSRVDLLVEKPTSPEGYIEIIRSISHKQ